MADVKGDRESKEAVVYRTLDQAFADRISRCFDSMCINFESEIAVMLFMQRFRAATDMWRG